MATFTSLLSSLNFGAVSNTAAAIFLADFLSGVVHWVEDAYIRRDTPLIGRWLGEANVEHHREPRAFVARSFLASSWDLLLVATAVLVAAWSLDLLTGPVWLFAMAVACANQIHKWAHRAPHENGTLITALQKMKLLQTQRHHGRHHQGKKDSHYCAITNFLNPILEELEFWNWMERLGERVFGLRRKLDSSTAAR
jgi:ubiquitin-conjugating enzyme E2 variant